MHVSKESLKPLSGAALTLDEQKILKWLRAAPWDVQTDQREPYPYKTKVPEFYSGVRLYHVQGGTGGTQGPLELFLKKLEYQRIISKQEAYPLAGLGISRFLTLPKRDLDNLGVGDDEDEDY